MEYTELNCIANIVSGYAIPSCDMTNEGTAIIKITNIREDGTLDLINTARYNKPITDKLKKFLLREKDIVVCMTGATIGKVARILKIDQDYIVNQRVAIIRAKNPELQDFVFQILTLPTFRKYVEIVGYGAAQPNISANAIGKYKFLNSGDISIQRRIASILSAYDNLIENNNRRIHLLEQMAENLYKEWLAYHNIVESSKEIRLTDIVSIHRGLSYSSEEIECEEGNDLINLKNIQAFGGFRLDGTKKYNGKYKAEQVVKEGDLVMGVTDMTQDRRTVGSVALIPNISNLSVISADLIKLESTIDNVFLYAMFRWGNVSKYISQFANGANVLHLRPQILKNINVLLPKKELIDQYVSTVKPMIETINKLNTETANLTRQRDLLLPRLMSGKLEVNA